MKLRDLVRTNLDAQFERVRVDHRQRRVQPVAVVQVDRATVLAVQVARAEPDVEPACVLELGVERLQPDPASVQQT
jgi:hypothetical protein